jgi:DNA-binding response OmpR family regulator
LSGAKILIVEDEPHIAESLSFILRRAEFDVDLVTDGTEALARLRREAYAAIVLDIMLPGMNGLEVLKTIRSDTQLSGLPVIVLTAKGQANDRKSAEAIGASAFITKPYSNAEVVECIRELVGA